MHSWASVWTISSPWHRAAAWKRSLERGANAPKSFLPIFSTVQHRSEGTGRCCPLTWTDPCVHSSGNSQGEGGEDGSPEMGQVLPIWLLQGPQDLGGPRWALGRTRQLSSSLRVDPAFGQVAWSQAWASAHVVGSVWNAPGGKPVSRGQGRGSHAQRAGWSPVATVTKDHEFAILM